jgi:hypothetical protein
VRLIVVDDGSSPMRIADIKPKMSRMCIWIVLNIIFAEEGL